MRKLFNSSFKMFSCWVIICMVISLYNFTDFFVSSAQAGWFDMDNRQESKNISNPSGTDENNNFPEDIGLNSMNIPFVIWSSFEIDGDSTLNFNKWASGTGWAKMGGALGADQLANISSPDHVEVGRLLIYNDVPYVFWSVDIDDPSESEIYASKWNGSNWTEMDGTTLGAGLVMSGAFETDLEVKMNSNGEPYIVISEGAAAGSVLFVKWTNDAGTGVCGGIVTDCWTNMAGDTSGEEAISSTYGADFDMDITPNGYPYVVWKNTTPVTQFTHWNGSAWTAMNNTPGVETIGYGAADFSPRIALNNSNIPYINWHGYENGGSLVQVLFKKWTPGTGWTGMNGVAAYDVLTDYALEVGPISSDILVDNSRQYPYVFWADRNENTMINLFISRWTPDNGWTKMDGTTAGYEQITDTELGDEIWMANIQLTSANVPYVNWQMYVDSTGNNDIFLSRYSADTNTWTKVDKSAGFENITDLTDPDYVDLVYFQLSSNGVPYVIYNANIEAVKSGSTDVYFSRWQGSDEGDVDITATLDPSISFVLSSTTCDLGVLTVNAIQACGYTATVTTNIGTGYTGYIEQDHPFQTNVNGETHLIPGPAGVVVEGSDALTGFGEYGIGIQTDDDTSWQEFVGTCASYDNLTTDLPAQAINGNSSRNVFVTYDAAMNGIDHGVTNFCSGVRITYQTPPGSYSQIVTITVVGNF